MESEGVLDPLNEVDVFGLLYLPRINKVIDEFVESWNYHPLFREGNMMPSQVFVAYFTALDRRNST